MDLLNSMKISSSSLCLICFSSPIIYEMFLHSSPLTRQIIENIIPTWEQFLLLEMFKKKEILRSADATRALQYPAEFWEMLPAFSLNEEIFQF